MNEQRKKIIVAEIQYWKKNKLLPAHFCDFLLTLYTKGEEEPAIAQADKQAIENKEKKTMHNRVFLLGAIGAILLTLLFLMDDWAIYLSPLVFLYAMLLLLGGRMFSTTYDARPILATVGSILLLAASLHTWQVFFPSNTLVLIGALILNCVTWLGLGKYLKMLVFSIAGFIGLSLIGVFLIL